VGKYTSVDRILKGVILLAESAYKLPRKTLLRLGQATHLLPLATSGREVLIARVRDIGADFELTSILRLIGEALARHSTT
jgi:hypothetical protein